MAVTVTTTVGGAGSNSYASVADGTTYFEGHPNEVTWTGAASDDARGRALIMATARIDQEDFVGQSKRPLAGSETTSATQALKWPRIGAVNAEGWTIDDDIVPEPVKKATMELALEILSGGVSLTDSGLEGFESIELGPLAVTPRHVRIAGALPAHVRRFLRPVLETPSALSFRIQRA